MINSELIEDTKFDEGFSSVPYKDDKGIWTAGYGTNISTISRHEGELLLISRLEDSISAVHSIFGVSVMEAMSMTQRNSLYILNYWIGTPRFKKFKKMVKAIKANDLSKAELELKDSRLYAEYRTRVNRLAHKLIGEI